MAIREDGASEIAGVQAKDSSIIAGVEGMMPLGSWLQVEGECSGLCERAGKRGFAKVKSDPLWAESSS